MASEPQGRGERATRFGWLLVFSLALHLLLTPMSDWLWLLSGLSTPSGEAAPPVEELDAIPIDLFEEPAPAAPEPEALPEVDPVALIDELVPTEPAVSAAPKPKPKPKPPPTATASAAPAVVDAGVAITAPSSSVRGREPDAGAPPKKVTRKQGSNIGDAVALAGEAGKLAKSNARLALTLYTDRIRSHPVGKRVEKMLPKLPQWNDFFGKEGLNPIRDFDRFFMAGPSFYHTEQVVVALQYNTAAAKVRAAIDQLVSRKGRWLKGSKVPAAVAYADRAERLFVMPAPNLVVVAPLHLKKQLLTAKLTGIPAPKGKEALVAFTKQPRYALARLGIEVPKTLIDAKLMVIPLSGGAVRLEVTAKEKSPELAKATATQVAKAFNSLLSLASGAANLLSQFGIGGKGITFPKISTETDGNVIFAQVELQQDHVDFLLDRAERQLVRRPQPTRPGPAPRASSRSPRGSSTAKRSGTPAKR